MKLIFIIEHKRLEELLSDLERPINRIDTRISDLHKVNRGQLTISYSE